MEAGSPLTVIEIPVTRSLQTHLASLGAAGQGRFSKVRAILEARGNAADRHGVAVGFARNPFSISNFHFYNRHSVAAAWSTIQGNNLGSAARGSG